MPSLATVSQRFDNQVGVTHSYNELAPKQTLPRILGIKEVLMVKEDRPVITRDPKVAIA
jgi:hypothetical protein